MRCFFKCLRAGITAVLYLIILTGWFSLLLGIGILRFIIPVKAWRRVCKHWMEFCHVSWLRSNYVVQEWTTSIEWDIKGAEQLQCNEWYLLIANHQSWADILVLQRVFSSKIPPLKFFLKKELLWSLPIASWACWLLDYPLMHRYPKRVLSKRPELKNKDVETTKKLCEKFKARPTTVANFIEGTRFSQEKRLLQDSPYQYLLRPRATGIAFTLRIMGEFFHKILNVTIIYPPKKATLFDFLSGDIKKIIVYVETIPITSTWLGDYQNDRQFRINFQKKLNNLWKQKDQLIKESRLN